MDHSPERLYSREMTAEYINGRGVPCTKGTLAWYATVGGGPAYRKFGRRVLYSQADIDTWIRQKLSPVFRNTSEYEARSHAE